MLVLEFLKIETVDSIIIDLKLFFLLLELLSSVKGWFILTSFNEFGKPDVRTA